MAGNLYIPATKSRKAYPKWMASCYFIAHFYFIKYNPFLQVVVRRFNFLYALRANMHIYRSKISLQFYY
jgi:hypothetical protein